MSVSVAYLLCVLRCGGKVELTHVAVRAAIFCGLTALATKGSKLAAGSCSSSFRVDASELVGCSQVAVQALDITAGLQVSSS